MPRQIIAIAPLHNMFGRTGLSRLSPHAASLLPCSEQTPPISQSTLPEARPASETVPPEIQASTAKLAEAMRDLRFQATGPKGTQVPVGSLGEMWAKELGLVFLQPAMENRC